MGDIFQTIFIFGGLSWVYKKFIKGKNSNEISESINSFIESIKTEFEKAFNTNKGNSHYKASTKEIFDEEKKRKDKESYENALTLYKAGVITKEELKEFKN
ncbi:hypothetical protein RJG79_00055 [Mycoplasmatota bacterium WC44]